MAENSLPEQRTELPTGKRMADLRREGQIFSSRDVSVVVSLLTGVWATQWIAAWLLRDIATLMRNIFSRAGERGVFSIGGVLTTIGAPLLGIGLSVGLVILLLATTGSLAVLLQTNWNIKQKKIEFKISRLNPISGLRGIFSFKGLVSTGKAIAKLAIILPLGCLALRGFAPELVNLVYLPVPQILSYIGVASMRVFYPVLYPLIALAIFDFAYGKFQWLKLNKMTKEEVKDEKKSIEGDESTRRRIIAKGLQRISQRIRESVPKAHVVITNPTHYAVALRYDRGIGSAPVVVAKGRGEIALRIREIAKEAGVPIVERKVLARALYASAKVGGEIPYELFKAVAEVFAFLYKLNRPASQTSLNPGGR